MSLKDFMLTNNTGNNSVNDVNGNNNIDVNDEEPFDLSQVGYDEETQSFFSREDLNNSDNTNVPQTPNVPSTNNYNIAQSPEFQALQQQNQQLQNQLLQVVQYIKQQPQQPTQQQPQFDINEVMSNPQQFQQFMEHNNKNIVNQVMQALQPRIQQYDQVANSQAQQAQLQNLYNQAKNTYPDFEQVISTDVNKALTYARQFGSFPAAYEIMKRELVINGNQSKPQQRRQRISRVENGANVTQDNLSIRNKVYDPQNSARNSALAALDDILSKR